MSTTVEDIQVEQNESFKVEGWRMGQLIAAGYSVPHAKRLAPCTEVDLHYAVKLVVEKGCAPDLAVRILL